MLIGFKKDFQKTGRSIGKTKLFKRATTTAAKNGQLSPDYLDKITK
jgi:hypothetical protein